VDITSNTFYKCTATSRTQICRKCLRIKLKWFRPYRRSWTSLPTPFISAQRLSERIAPLFDRLQITLWHSWFRHCATSRNDADSLVSFEYPSDCTMVLGSMGCTCSSEFSTGSRVYLTTPLRLKLDKYFRLNLHFNYKLQDDQKVSVHLMITIQKVTSNVQSVLRQSPDIY
jgi:hypothetical protein